MGKIHEVLAVEKQHGETSRRLQGEAVTTFTKKDGLFEGVIQEIEPLEESSDGPQVVMAERAEKLVVETVAGKLDWVSQAVREHWRSMGDKEAANQLAKADVTVDGETVVAAVPATFLLSMEGQLQQVRKVFESIPTRDGAVKWVPTEYDDVLSAPTSKKQVTRKVQHVEKIHPPTEHQPGTHEVLTMDRPVAIAKATALTSKWSSERKAMLLRRLDHLLSAVKKARSQANHTDVPDEGLGRQFCDYLFQGINDSSSS